jgi:FAD:protein FMN transferase
MRLILISKKMSRHSTSKLGACLLLISAACSSLPAESTTIQREIGVMGTSLAVEITAQTRLEALQASEMAIRAVEAAEQRLSTWIDDSPLSLLNRGTQPETALPADHADHTTIAPRTDALLTAELELAEFWSGQTHGAFEPRAGALIQAWDLRGQGRIPTPAERIAAAADHSQWEEGGFGKGAALDAALSALRQTGVESAALNLGGQISVLDGTGTVIEVSHPHHRQQPVANFWIDSGSVATSGNSERGLRINGRRIGHLLDPRSGQPAPDFGTVTVWAPSAFAADCLSTALFVMGPDAAMTWAEQNPSIEVLILQANPNGLQLRMTSKLEQRLQQIPFIQK